jgi:twitching motility protein PilT
MEDTRLGSILLECKVVPEKELQNCLEIQALTGGTRPLGQILVEQGVISRRTLDNLLQLQQARRSMSASKTVVEGTDTNRFLRAAVKAGANELHLSEGRQPLMRVAGNLESLGDEPLGGPEVWQFVRDHMGKGVLDAVAEQESVTREFTFGDVARGRITAFRHFDGLALTIRMHPKEVRTAEESCIDEFLLESVRSGKGLVLVVGEQASGITETLATLVHESAKEEGRFVLVLDETFEYPMPDGGAIVELRRVGEHTPTYHSGLRTALREDPDVIIVSETDAESFNLALHAAESGRLVITVVHARSTVAALERILRFYPSYDEARVRSTLASILLGVLTVRLVPNENHTAQVLATEVLRFDEAVRDLMRIGSLRKINSLIRMEGDSKGHSMDQSILQLLDAGVVRFEDVFQHAEDKAMLLQAHHGVQGGRAD